MNLYEISMDESLRTELLHDHADDVESMALPDYESMPDLNSLSLSAALML